MRTMIKYTQAGYDRQGPDIRNGFYELGTADLRSVEDFHGRHRVEIGEGSLLGGPVQLGESCRIGDNVVQEGGRFDLGPMAAIGRNCTFRDAHISEGSRIGSGCIFLHDCTIDKGVEIGDDITLPMACTLFGIRALGTTFLKISPVEGCHLYAFVGLDEIGKKQVFVYRPGALWVLDDFHQLAVDLCQSQTIRPQGHELLAAARYLKERFSGMIR